MAESAKANRKSWLRYFLIITVITFILAFLVFSFITRTLIFAEEQRTDETNYTYSLDEIIVNLKEGSRYLKAGIALGYNLQRDEAAIERSKVQARDAIITILRNKSAEELLLPENEARLKSEIRSRINSFFSEDIVTDVYLIDFLIQ